MHDWLNPFKSYKIEDRSFVFYIKREIRLEVSKARFSEQQRANIDVVVSEITSNLVKHAGNGELLYRIRTQPNASSDALDIISIDNGPGMADPVKMMQDGVSTTGTLGQGLGAINRLSNKTQIFSIQKWGTVLYSSVGCETQSHVHKTTDIDVRAITINKPREIVCGDGYRFRKTESGAIVFFGDGLGHGTQAKEAIDRAGDFFMRTEEHEPVNILRQMHERIKNTRGLVGVVADFNANDHEWNIAGVGNISVRLYTGSQYHSYMSYNGSVGLAMPKSMKASTYVADRNQRLIMCSDGIHSRWELSRYPSILRQDDLVAASAIYKDYCRGNDDASVVIAKVL